MTKLFIDTDVLLELYRGETGRKAEIIAESEKIAENHLDFAD